MDSTRRALIAATGALVAPGVASSATMATDNGRKVLRFAFSAAETSFDPVKVLDNYSRTVTAHIFEAPYRFDHLARPPKIVPNLAEGMPEVSADYRTWTIKVRRGIFFSDDPAFKGRKRELVAADIVYAMKRVYDPALKSPLVSALIALGFVGLKALRDAAIQQKKPFDYDREVEGLQAIDRYTLRARVETPRPRLIEIFAAPDLLGAVAREVVEHYGNEIDAHPVGTGPFRLKQWRRSSLIVLERNLQYRDERYDGEPAPDDAEGQALLRKFKGRRLPLVDEVRVSVINESQPRWLAFLNGQIDVLGTSINPVPADFVNIALPHGKLAPNLAKRGIGGGRNINADSSLTYFNMEHPVIGGYTPDKVALRRAISLGYDVQREIRLARRGAAVPAQSPIVPHTSGYEPAFKSEMSDFDPARARALLDLYGYVDRDGDGWREMPDGSPLLLEMATEPEQRSRIYNELWQKSMAAIGIRMRFKIAQWPENMKSAHAGTLMMWLLGSTASAPDGQDALARLYGPEAGGQNLARFKLPAFDRLYERMLELPDGPERDALYLEAKRLAVAYMPMKILVHRLDAEVWQPWLLGYRRPVFWYEWWHRVDIGDGRPEH